ncbi:MAG TPA: carboxypeptidase-like regulatory domain-containing protein, partial [Chitinophagaceae bacterium]|nr:carboxypeptidase-like regulatory domain-containing protein [Chitinophagaceae bacterium]
MLFLCFSATAQTGSLRGVVRTSDGKPAAHVYVQLKEIKRGTITADDGSYQLPNIPTGNYTIIVSFIGLQTIQKSVQMKSGTQAEDFELVENETELAEIVVTANRSVNNRPATIGKLPIKPMDLPQAVVT